MPVDNLFGMIFFREENTELFGDLETYAVSMRKATSESVSFAKLMDNLLIVELSDLEKVKSLLYCSHW